MESALPSAPLVVPPPALDLTGATDLCRLLGDPTRVRLLSLLVGHELSVGELSAVTQLAQPRVSTHLGKLREAGLVAGHRDGASTLYRAPAAAWPQATGALVAAVLDSAQDPLLAQDAARVPAVLAAREGDGSWADGVAGQMARHYSPGRTWESVARGLAGLADLGRVIDIAAGDGAIAELLAPSARSIDCVDSSRKVVAAARERLGSIDNITVQRGDMHELPYADGRFDHALMLAALSYSTRPAVALAEAARVLAPGGRLVATTLHRHGHDAEVARYDHVNGGFSVDELTALASSAGLRVQLCAVTAREKRPPHFEILTLHAVRA
ncbi:MAG: metalloregulator ArsR/SmtB family transcription factor [Alphaproteobacteria bacterium]|nr:metalloregulator ArsR/SmtB family transcription factor [Alphaproteobacteria bacterium]